jgi:gamma-glutamylcyclotransferase (GGCT)/AIG2-like uncharacterized protein YtfP
MRLTVREYCAYFFAYGTLRKNAASPLSALLAREAEFVAQGALRAALYDLGSYPGAVLSDDPFDRVAGDVYWLRDAQALFDVLDAYEECSQHYKQPHEYRRALVDVATPDAAPLSAWTYLYNRPTGTLQRIAGGDYLRFLGMKIK